MLDNVSQIKREPKRVINRIVKHNFFILAYMESGFHSYVILNNLSLWRTVVKLVKNGSSIVSLKKFNGYVDKYKKIPQYLHFRCGRPSYPYQYFV